MTLSLKKRDEYIKQIKQQMQQKEQLITQKLKELNVSKKDNKWLEPIYADNTKYVKQVKKNATNALKGLANYLSKLDVSPDDTHEKDRDLKSVLKEINKHK